MKTQEELNALKEQIENLNKKLAELTDEELAQVAGGGSRKAFVKGDWVMTDSVLEFLVEDTNNIAFEVKESNRTNTVLQTYIRSSDKSGYRLGHVHQVPTVTCWHISKPSWI